jgi:hypothetical protein
MPQCTPTQHNNNNNKIKEHIEKLKRNSGVVERCRGSPVITPISRQLSFQGRFALSVLSCMYSVP